MLTSLIAAMLYLAPVSHSVTYTSKARGVVTHKDCAADHPDRFTASERAPLPTAKGRL